MTPLLLTRPQNSVQRRRGFIRADQVSATVPYRHIAARPIALLATVLLIGLATSAGAEPIGRLFFSPGERTTLDQWRKNNGGDAPITAETEQITLNGFVRRGSGKTTIWINQVPQHEDAPPRGVAVLKPAAKTPFVPLLLPSGKKVDLKAGQTFDAANGKIREGYEDTATPLPQEAAK